MERTLAVTKENSIIVARLDGVLVAVACKMTGGSHISLIGEGLASGGGGHVEFSIDAVRRTVEISLEAAGMLT